MKKVQINVSGKTLEALAEQCLAARERGRKVLWVGTRATLVGRAAEKRAEELARDRMHAAMRPHEGALEAERRALGLTPDQHAAHLLA